MTKYWVDLNTLEVEAKDADEAFKKALHMLRNGEVEIDIVNVEPTGEE